jgi:hypothetical protein
MALKPKKTQNGIIPMVLLYPRVSVSSRIWTWRSSNTKVTNIKYIN